MLYRCLSICAVLWLAFGEAWGAEQPIELNTPTGVIKGTLTTPERAEPAPVVLIVAGSGPTDRDGNSAMLKGPNNSLKQLAAALSEQGVASVRYDKRGVGGSSAALPDRTALRLETYVSDAEAWVRLLAQDARFNKVVVLGHSEGALIGLLAAQHSPAAGYVSLAGSAQRASDLLRRQLQGHMPPELAEQNEAILTALEAGHTVADVPAPLLALYRPSGQRYLMSWMSYQPTDELARLKMPCLIVQGSTDIQIRVADAEALHTANRACGLKVIDGMNHVLKRVPADRPQQLASYSDPTLPLAPELVQAVAAFLAAKP
ncbi:alpha/beta hydrolase [Aquabacterium sp.]|uniref:alpha/beta hydrolase n=1 Tax=Aquabacterium sp. TaxID=1872578 RepID=UPI0035ADB9EE